MNASPRLCCLMQENNSLFTERIASMLEKIIEIIFGGSRQPTLIGFRNSCGSKYVDNHTTVTVVSLLTETTVLSCEM